MSTGGAAGGRIVVGVDGSQPSRAALRWAVRQAHLTAGEVDAVLAFGAGPAVAAEAAARALAEAVDAEVFEEEWAVDIRQRPRRGDPVQILLDASQGAELLVLGARGPRGSGSALGAVGTQCARRAGCPVVLVPAGAPG